MRELRTAGRSSDGPSQIRLVILDRTEGSGDSLDRVVIDPRDQELGFATA
jgi:hypothetical protein